VWIVSNQMKVDLAALTIAIKRPEEEFGGQLFERGRLHSRLTKLGIPIQRDLAQIERSAATIKRKAEKLPADHPGIHNHTATQAPTRVNHTRVSSPAFHQQLNHRLCATGETQRIRQIFWLFWRALMSGPVCKRSNSL
jgi:DNA-binding transcriptional LysR family regulator